MRGDRLVYYTDLKAKQSNTPIGYVPLQTASSFDVSSVPKGSIPNIFQISTTEPDRIWYLRCETEEEMHRWMNACIMHSKWSKEVQGSHSTKSDPVGKAPVSKNKLHKLIIFSFPHRIKVDF